MTSAAIPTVIPTAGELCLAPMVRIGGLPFRALCLSYGADKVWSEEIIAKRISKCTRVENHELGTIDFVHQQDSCGHSNAVVVFRTDPRIEAKKVVFQMGVGSATEALAAALVVQKDVAGIDINMGCPMKFSIQGGMGAALLQKPEVAADIVKTLSDNLDIPVSAKIRLFDTTERTIEFMRLLEGAGASAITVHFRQRGTRSRDPADWSSVEQLIRCVSVPIYANGDFYDPADIIKTIDMGCAGVLLARPLLLNPSLLRFRDGGAPPGSPSVCRYDQFLTLKETIKEYIALCIKYDLPYQLAKYTIMEMMNSGRHTKPLLAKMKDIGLNCGRLPEFEQVQSSGSMATLLSIFSSEEDCTIDDCASQVNAPGSGSYSIPEAPGGWGEQCNSSESCPGATQLGQGVEEQLKRMKPESKQQQSNDIHSDKNDDGDDDSSRLAKKRKISL